MSRERGRPHLREALRARRALTTASYASYLTSLLLQARGEEIHIPVLQTSKVALGQVESRDLSCKSNN